MLVLTKRLHYRCIRYCGVSRSSFQAGLRRCGLSTDAVNEMKVSVPSSNLPSVPRIPFYSRLWEAKYKIFTFTILSFLGLALASEKNERIEYDNSGELLRTAEKNENLKKYSEAEEDYLKCYKLRQQEFGIDHINTLNALLFLIDCYLFQKKYKEAEDALIRLLGLQKQHYYYNKNHPDILLTLYYLGYTCRKGGKERRAQMCFDEFYSKLNDPTILERDTSLSTQKTLFHSLFRLVTKFMIHNLMNDAEDIANEISSFLTLSSTFGPNHEITRYSMILLASLYQDLQEYEKAELLLLSCYEKMKESYGEIDNKTIGILHNLATVYFLEKNYSKSKYYYSLCYSKYLKVYQNNDNHPNLIGLLLSLGLCSQALLAQYSNSPVISGDDTMSPSLGSFPGGSGLAYWWDMLYHIVSPSYAYSLLTSPSGSRPSSVSSTIPPPSYYTSEKEAEQYFHLYYEKQRRLYGQTHRITLKAMFYLGRFYLSFRNIQEKKLKAKEILSKCYFYQSVSLGKGHNDTKETFYLLQLAFSNQELADILKNNHNNNHGHTDSPATTMGKKDSNAGEGDEKDEFLLSTIKK
jgi:hypothetical protein